MRVLIAEDDLLVREGIVHILDAAGIEVAGRALDEAGLLRQVESLRPDMVVTDIRMPPTFTDEGLRAARRIAASHPKIGVLVLSQHLDTEYAKVLLADHPAGVGYLLKDRVFDAAVLVDALRRIVEGESVLDPTIVARLLGRRRRQGPLDALTEREREVLALIAEGRSNAAIARSLVVTERTIESHSTQIFQKLGLEHDPNAHRRVLAAITWLQNH
jgi:DNA-binding NarL/FixJ family response regulator